MPCFLAGVCLAQTVAALLKVPLVEVSHQQGHLAAALWSAGRQELFASPFLAWHLSGAPQSSFTHSLRGGTWIAAALAAPQTFLPASSSTGRAAAGAALPSGKGLGPAESGGRSGGRLPGEVPGDGIFPCPVWRTRCSNTWPGPDAGRRRRPLLWPAFAVPWKPPPVTPGSGIRAFRWCFPGAWPPIPCCGRI